MSNYNGQNNIIKIIINISTIYWKRQNKHVKYYINKIKIK